MPGLVRGQASDCGNPLLIMVASVEGNAVDLSSLSFQVFDKTGSTPMQVHPQQQHTREQVSLDPCPLGDRLDAGRYVARWLVPLAEPLGLHEIRWYLKLTPTSVERSFSEDFFVVEQQVNEPVSYATLEQFREEGVSSSQASDALLQRRIRRASASIERWTGRWFYARPQALQLDGPGHRVLLLDQPIVSVTEVAVNGESVPLSSLVVYNRHLTQELLNPDDRNNPRIEVMRGDCSNRELAWFPKGSQNVRVVGRFGYTDPNGTPDGKVPDAITDACMLLVMRDLPLLSDADARDDIRSRHRITSMTTRDQAIQMSPVRGSAWSGDPEVDEIIEAYRRPPAIGSV